MSALGAKSGRFYQQFIGSDSLCPTRADLMATENAVNLSVKRLKKRIKMKTRRKQPWSPGAVLTIALSILLGIFARPMFANPPPPGSGADVQLDSWPFSDTNWLSSQGYAPLTFTNVLNEPDGDGNCLWLDTTNATAAYLFYNVVETNGFTNLICSNGTISLWFSPDWSSTNAGGSGPGQWANLIRAATRNTSSMRWAI